VNRGRRTGWIVGIFLVLVLAFAVFAPAPSQDETLILRRFLEQMHVEVASGGTPVDGSAFLLMHDARTADQDAALLDWADRGGTLIVADVGSTITAGLADVSGRQGFTGTTDLATDCVHPAILGVGHLTVAAADAGLDPADGANVPCFVSDAGSYALFVPRGDGMVVLLGGTSVMSNELLREGDNAFFVLDLLGGGVVLGSPTDPNAPSTGIWAALPTGARAAILELAIAVCIFALARGRRLGRPHDEALPSPIPSGELVRAAGALYRSARAYRYCATLLRRGTSARLARRLGITSPPDDPELPVFVARASGQDADLVRRVLDGPDPGGDEDLIALGHELDALHRRSEGADR
jgi:Domain of unknown function (DUF4350)